MISFEKSKDLKSEIQRYPFLYANLRASPGFHRIVTVSAGSRRNNGGVWSFLTTCSHWSWIPTWHKTTCAFTVILILDGRSLDTSNKHRQLTIDEYLTFHARRCLKFWSFFRLFSLETVLEGSRCFSSFFTRNGAWRNSEMGTRNETTGLKTPVHDAVRGDARQFFSCVWFRLRFPCSGTRIRGCCRSTR